MRPPAIGTQALSHTNEQASRDLTHAIPSQLTWWCCWWHTDQLSRLEEATVAVSSVRQCRHLAKCPSVLRLAFSGFSSLARSAAKTLGLCCSRT